MPLKRHKKPTLSDLYDAGLRRKAHLLSKKTHTATEADVEYWLNFVVNWPGLHHDRRENYVRGWNVRGKIENLKKQGRWPPEPRHNVAFLRYFCAFHHYPIPDNF